MLALAAEDTDAVARAREFTDDVTNGRPRVRTMADQVLLAISCQRRFRDGGMVRNRPEETVWRGGR